MNQYLWGNINKAIKSTYFNYPICLKFNPGKPVCTAPGRFQLHNGRFKVWQMHFIQLPLSHEYKYVSVMVYMFSYQTETFPCRQATASSVAQILLENIIPTWFLLNFTVSKVPILLARCFDKPVLFSWFYNTFTALTTVSALVQSNALKALLRFH